MITGLEGDLRTLITRWDRFFSGGLKVPPNREKEILKRRLRSLAENASGAHSGDQFRLNQLQHRFMSYSTNWERLLREREEGVRRFIPGQKKEAGPSGVPGPQSPVPNVRPVTFVDGSDAVDLFERWCAAKADVGQEIKIGRQAFEAQIEKQQKDIETRMGSEVAFEVTVADGKVKVTARRTNTKDGKE